MWKYLLMLFMTCMVMRFLTWGQEGCSIAGTVRDNEGLPLPGAQVRLMKDTAIVVGTVTELEGIYRLETIKTGHYTLRVASAGLKTVDTPVSVYRVAQTLPDIRLQPLSETVQEVVIRSVRPAIEVKGDKWVVNVENSALAAGASVMDVLQTAPGVTVGANDNLALQGRAGAVVWIDGKPVPMQGVDLASILRGMPSSTVEKLELIARPGANQDAESGGGIINIVTKRGKGQGWNSALNLNYGQGKYPKYGTGINAGYRNKKWSLYASYNYSYRYWFNHLMLTRRFGNDPKNPDFYYVQDNFSLLNFKNHAASVKADYALTGRTKMGVAISGNSNRFEPKADNVSQAIGESGQLLYNFNTTGRHQSAFYNYAVNVNLQHKWDSSGRMFNADADYAAFSNKSRQDFLTRYLPPGGFPYLPDYALRSDLGGLTTIRSLKADYLHPLGVDARLDAGMKFSRVDTDNEPVFYEKVDGHYELDTKRSNHFVYKEQISAAYARLQKEWGRGSLQLGLRMEHTYARWLQQVGMQRYDTAYLQLFPDIVFTYPLPGKHEMSIQVNRTIERPNYEQLNPFRYFIDKTTYKTGEPYLQPASYYSVALSHIFNKQCVTTFSYGINKGVMATVIQPSETEDSVTVQTVKNLDQMVFVGLSGSYSFAFASWWHNVVSTNVYYAGYRGNLANTPLNRGGITFDVKTNHTWLLPGQFGIEAGLFYKYKERYAYMLVEPSWMVQIGVQKHFWNKKATLKLNIQDLFYKGYPRATSEYNNYSEDFIAKRETRVFNVSLVYQLGKEMLNAAKIGGGAEEEKRRASSGA